jgi:hypothetical protein
MCVVCMLHVLHASVVMCVVCMDCSNYRFVVFPKKEEKINTLAREAAFFHWQEKPSFSCLKIYLLQITCYEKQKQKIFRKNHTFGWGKRLEHRPISGNKWMRALLNLPLYAASTSFAHYKNKIMNKNKTKVSLLHLHPSSSNKINIPY